MIKYFKIYHTYIGNKIFVAYFLTLAVVTFDGLGLALFLPFISSILSQDGSAKSLSDESSFVADAITLYTYKIQSYFSIENQLMALFVLIIMIFISKSLLVFLGISINSYIRASFLKNIKMILLKRSSEISYEYFSSIESGKLINVVNEQAFRSMQCFFSLNMAGTQALSALLYVCMSFYLAPNLGLVLILVGIMVLFIYRYINSSTKIESQKLVEFKTVFLQQLNEFFPYFIYIKSTGEFPRLIARMQKTIQNIQRTQIKLGILGAATKASQELIVVCVVITVLMVFSLMAPEQISGLLLSLLLLYRGVTSVLSSQGHWQGALDTIGSIQSLHHEIEKLGSNKDPIAHFLPSHDTNDALFKCEGMTHQWALKPVLSDVSLTIEKGKCYGFVGESGSGKSTLINIINGLIQPTCGSVQWNFPTKKGLGRAKSIGYVTQQPVIYSGSILYNLLLTDGTFNEQPNYVRDSVRDVLNSVGLWDVVLDLANGVDTEIGEKGKLLSGGQIQRLFIARELFRKPDVLILDEATSSLDDLSEEVVARSIEKLKGKLTILIIAHRPKTIELCDVVYEVNKGFVRERKAQ